MESRDDSPNSKNMLDPDARFLLANERTLLAWVRTALGLMAGGIALSQFAAGSELQVSLGIIAILLGTLMATVGLMRFQSADRAIRAGRLPVMGHAPVLQVIGVVGFGMTIVIIELLRLAR